MGLLGWFKKEIESSARSNRRQSAPPLGINQSYQDQAYRRAIEKFREYRNSGRFERLNETKNASAITQSDITGNNKTIEEISITDVEIQAHERERLLQSRRNRNVHKHDNNKTDAIYSNCNPEEVSRNKRLSLPIIRVDGATAPVARNNRKFNKLQPTCTIDEIEEFEQHHCQKLNDLSIGNGPTTPPSKFFRNNSEPFNNQFERKTTTEVRKQTPKRLMGRTMLRRNKGKAPQPPQQQGQQSAKKNGAGDASETTINFYNGNFKHYGVSTHSVDDEFVISSRAYKGNLRQERLEQINSVGESSCSLSSENTNNDKNAVTQERRQSLLNYQTVINKHGEEVEYALPYNERDSTLDIPPLPTAPIPTENQHQTSMQFEQMIDQNFKFLNSKLDFLNSQIENGEDLQPINTLDLHRRQNIQVTDLDKSNEAGLASFPAQTGDVMKDLDALTNWSQNFEKNDGNLSPLEQYQASQKGVKVFNACDIKYKAGSLRNSFSTPLEFSNGYFHKTPITLRSTLPNYYSINNFADSGCKRDFDVLSQVKHMSIVSLMGICFDKDLRVTSLIMEPFDFTLNHYLHQMDKFYNIQQTVSIIHQIASATQYLNECGYIHSNISSHAVLVRENPFAVKLSSFELATEILPREMNGKFYEIQHINSNCDVLGHDSVNDHLTFEKYGKLSKQHFYNRTSLPISKLEDEIDVDDELKLPYSIAYRRMYSMHHYQAPELLVPTTNNTVKYVKPTVKCDVYGLGLLLWELINRVVPYVIFNHDELINGLLKGNTQLPVLDKSSIIFREIFESCLHADSNNRISSVSIFITMLEDLQLLGYEKDKIEVLEIIEPRHHERSEMKMEKNIKNSDQRDKLREKIYFSKTEMDPQKRFENALTPESLANLGDVVGGARDTSKISESIQSSEIEPNLVSFSGQQPGILLQDDALDRIRKTVESQRDITPKKPSRRRDDEHMPLEVSKNSTMFQSFFGLDKLQTPKVDKNVIYERTSTLKKRMKASGSSVQKKTVKGLFDSRVERPINDFGMVPNNIKPHENSDEKKILHDQFEKMNDELNEIINNYNKSDFMQEIVNEIQERERTKKSNDVLVSSFLNKGIPENNLSRSFEELPVNDKENEFGVKLIEASPKGGNLNRYSSHESFSLPHTPIARQNMIRRNAWLSDTTRNPSGSQVSDGIVRRSLNFYKTSPASEPKPPQHHLKQYNVNIKIHHNDLDSHASTSSATTTTTPKSTNLNQSALLNSSSVKIKLYNSSSKSSPIVKINNIDLNKTSYPEDINRKYYPQMPELLSDAIQNKRDKSIINFSQVTPFEEERNKINNEMKLQNVMHNEALAASEQWNGQIDDKDDETEERVIVPHPISVRETVKYLETTFNPKSDDAKPTVAHHNVTKNQQVCEETQTDVCDFLGSDEVPAATDEEKASEGNQKQENLQQSFVGDLPVCSKKIEYVVNHSTMSTQTPKKITTKLTLNVKKITGRSSDVTHLKRVQEQVKNNPELFKQIQAHLKESSLATCNNEISASCSNLIAKACSEDIVPVGHCKYFCRNCGFTMIPADKLQQIQNSGRLSIASSIAESLQSMKFDESLQSLAAIRKIKQSTETRSTEDLYIDDDFCQGISQSLAANMELLPPPDFFDTLDFNIISAEIFHTQDIDDTLTGDEKLQEIETGTVRNEKVDENDIDQPINASYEENEKRDDVPICDEDCEIKQDTDEPKV